MKKRIMSLVLAITMCLSLMVFSAPIAGASYVYNPDLSISQGYQNAFLKFLLMGFEAASGKINGDTVYEISSQLKFPHVGKCTYLQLEDCVEYYNASIYGKVNAILGGNKFQSRGAIRPDFDNGIYRIYDHSAGHWVTDAQGNFPYVLMDETAGDVPAGEGSESAGACRWLSASGTEITNNFRKYSKAAIDAKALQLTEWGHPCQAVKVTIGPKGKEVECWAIRDDYWYYYCDEDGNRLVALVEPSVTETVRPSIDNSGNLIEGDNGFIMDNDNGIFAVIDQIGNRYELDFDGAVWDFSSDSYTVNAYKTVNEGDNYYYTYYTYNVTYNITNTYITYIGSNEPYEREEYELYYQLPDGRSSADLTAEEIAGMSFEFYDIVNYQRSTDNVSVRGLYHFDGGIEDSSYFTGQGRFIWNSGASITFMESPSPFEGNLYLDNTAHSFTVALPANIGSGDFQVQFRHYQASELDTQDNIENKLIFGDAVLSWDESSLYFQGERVADLPIGTWHEIALSRFNGTFYVYLNGLLVGTGTGSSFSFGKLDFIFGSTSRAYTMLDELRVLNVCQFEGADYYSPTVVPFDSNLVLVLPDEKLPIADSYYQITPTPNAVQTWDFTGCMVNCDVPDSFVNYGPVMGTRFVQGKWHYNSGDVYGCVGGLTFDTGDFYDSTWRLNVGYGKMTTGISLPMQGLCSSSKTYTLTVVLTDGTKLSHTFNSGSIQFNGRSQDDSWEATINNSNKSTSNSHVKISTGIIRYAFNNLAHYFSSAIVLTPAVSGGTFDVSYIELVEGASSSLEVEEITSVYSGIDLQPNTAAIQTVIPVNGYTVGGIRPSMPNRGDCWFPVMNNRITSVQIYTGTHWEEVNARWWTGSRWIPIYAFDINTLEDLFDIADGDSTVPLLPDQNAFLRWWQLQWLDFRNWLENALSNSGSGGGTSLPDDDTLPGEDATEDDDGWSFVDLLVKTKDGIWKITKGIVKTAAGGITGLVLLIEDAGDFFTPYEDGYSEGVGDLMNYGGDDIWD